MRPLDCEEDEVLFKPQIFYCLGIRRRCNAVERAMSSNKIDIQGCGWFITSVCGTIKRYAPPSDYSGAGGVRLVEFLFRPGADFLQLGVQPADLGIQLDEGQARRADQPLRLHSGVVVAALSLQQNAGGRLMGSRVAL